MSERREIRERAGGGQQGDRNADRRLARRLAHGAHPFALQSSSSLVAKILLRFVPVGSLKKASVSVPRFCAIAVSGSGRITCLTQSAGIGFTSSLSSSVKSIAV